MNLDGAYVVLKKNDRFVTTGGVKNFYYVYTDLKTARAAATREDGRVYMVQVVTGPEVKR